MRDIGQASTILMIVVTVWSLIVLTIGLKRQKPSLIKSGRNGVVAAFMLGTLAIVSLMYGFISRDFSIRYVAEHSNRELPYRYTFAALWGGQQGSLLFWVWILTIFGALVVYQSRKDEDNLTNHALIPIAFCELFFTILITVVVNPFEKLPRPVADGMGLTPLLQHSRMMIHPPTLYTGFISTTIPFAFAVGALMSGAGTSQWLVKCRRWAIFSWITLTAGVMLGGSWAYEELGWGGYWAWDPVENASLIPWFMSTAFLHSIMIQEKRNMLKVWNIILVILTFELCIFGTFLTRSGVISSVHSFAESNIGPFFLTFIGITSVGSLVLGIRRREELKSPNKLDSLLSRESSFLLNNWILAALAFATLCGTVFPVLSEWFTGDKISVSAPFFNKVNVPIGLALLILTGIGPIVSWKKATLSNFKKTFAAPLISGAIGGSIFGFLLSAWGYPILNLKSIYSIICIFGSFFVLATIMSEFYRGSKVRAKRDGLNFFSAIMALIGKNKRRYGGYIIHVGVVMIFIGILGSSAYQKVATKTLAIGESLDIGKFTLKYIKDFSEIEPNVTFQGVELAVLKSGKPVDTLRPSRGTYVRGPEGEPTVEAAIRRRPLGDLYVACTVPQGGQVTLQAYYNPLVNLIWFGTAIMVLGGMVAIAEKTRKK